MSTWVLDEVRLAVQKGYQVLDISEVYEYKVTKYDPHTRGGFYLLNILTRSSNLKQRLAATPRGFEPPRSRNVMSRITTLEKAC